MTLSKEKRIEDLARALTLMLEQLGDRRSDRMPFKLGEPPFDTILPTTWPTLEEFSWIRIIRYLGGGHFKFTGRGWLAAMEAGDHTQSEQFNQNLGLLMKTLKAKVDERTRIVFASIAEVASTSGLSEAFVWNIIESDAISELKDRVGAEWEGSRKNTIKIPIGFGQERL